MNNYDEFAEMVCLSRIATEKDSQEKYLIACDIDWFFNSKHKIILKLWKENRDNLDMINLRNNIGTTEYVSQEWLMDLYSGSISFEGTSYFILDDDRFDFNTAIRSVKNKFLQRVMDEKLTNIKTIIYKESIGTVSTSLIEFFHNIRKQEDEGNDIRRMDTGFEQVNPGVLNFGSSRPKFSSLIPLRKSIITIGGDSGHHKSNQAIDILYRYVVENPTHKVMFFSAEMDFEEVRDRIFAKALRIPLQDIILRNVDTEDVLSRIRTEFPSIVSNFIIIPPSDFKNSGDMARLIIKYEPAVWSLDFLQYFAQVQAGNKASEQNINVMELIASSKMIAQLTNSLAIILSQIRKKKDGSLTHFPRVDDLEWSGLTKQLSHSIGLCFWAYKINNKAIKDAFYVSWQKARNAKSTNELLSVEPEYCNFKTYTDNQKEAEKYLNY